MSNTFTINLNALAFNGRAIQIPDLPEATNATVQTFIIQQLSRHFTGRANTAVQNSKLKGKAVTDNGLDEALRWLTNGLQGKTSPRTRESDGAAPKTREDLKPFAERNVELRIARAILVSRNPRGQAEKTSAYNKRIEALMRAFGEFPLRELAVRALASYCKEKGIEMPQGIEKAKRLTAWINNRGYTPEAVAAELDTLCLKHGIIDEDFDDFDFEGEANSEAEADGEAD